MIDLIEKEGRYFEKCKVVISPTKDRTDILINKFFSTKSLLEFRPDLRNASDKLRSGWTNHHIHVLSYGNIAGGDYVFSDYYGVGKVREGNFRNYRGDFPLAVEYSNTTVPYNEDGSYTMEGQKIYTQDCYKIIATTDQSLKLEHDDSVPFPKRKSYPTPSHKFIKAFCEQGGIDRVLVEYEVVRKLSEITLTPYNDGLKLKTDSHNTITIKPVEKRQRMYSAVDLMGNQSGSFDHFLLNSPKFSQEERETIMDAVHDWITKTL